MLLKRIAGFLLGTGLAVVAAELYVRPLYTLAVAYEPGVGYVNAPGRVRWGLEGIATSTWGSHGVRVTPRYDGRVGGGAPVLVLGDSFTEGLMVGDSEVFVAVAQDVLDRRAIDVGLINAGRSTMSAADYVALAERYRELFRPAWTVVEIRSSDLAEDAWAIERTHFARDHESGRLYASAIVPPLRSGRGGKLFELRQRSMFLGYGAVRAGRFRTAAAAEPPIFQASRQVPVPVQHVSAPVEEELDLLVQAWSGRLTVLFASAATSEADPIEERVRAHCERLRASCLFTRREFVELKARGRDPFGFYNTYPGEGHMNADGHAVAGRLLADELARLQTSIIEARN